MDIIGTRTGEIFFARTPVMWGRIGRVPRFGVRRCLMVGQLRMDDARTGEKYFAPTHAVRCYIGRASRFGVRRWLMVGCLRMNGARAGGLKCAAQEVDFGNRIGYSSTIYMK